MSVSFDLAKSNGGFQSTPQTDLWIVLLVVFVLVLAVFSLIIAAVFMLRTPPIGQPAVKNLPLIAKNEAKKRMATVLKWRIGLSIVLFSGIWLAWILGYIQPTGIRFGQ